MLPGSELGLLDEAVALLAICSAVFAMISLGGLAVAQSDTDTDTGAPRGWVVSASISWGVFILSMCAFAALSPVP